MINRTLLIIVAAVILSMGGGMYLGSQWEASMYRQDLAIRNLVLSFGTQFKNVSIFSPDVKKQIQKSYAKYVTPELLASWESDPKQAPGQLTQSPWPDHVAITGITKQQIDYEVDADIVLMVDGGPSGDSVAGTIPAHFVVSPQQDGSWLISRYQSP